MKIALCCCLTAIAALAQPPVPPDAPLAPVPPRPPIAPRAPAMAGHRLGVNFDFQDHFRDSEEDRANRDYDRGRRAIEKRQWETALTHFNEVALGKHRADAGLYWKAIALTRLGRGPEGVAALATLVKSHPQSRWAADARKLSAEIGQSAARPASPESASEDELKLVAVGSLAHGDPDRSVPLLEKLIERRAFPELQDRALLMLSRIHVPKAREIVVKIAKGDANPDLQVKAVRYLGNQGDQANRELLSGIYSSSSDTAIRKAVLHSYLSAGDRDRLLAVAKGDSNVQMRREAIHCLGSMGASSQLSDLYAAETAPEVRGSIMRAMVSSGNTAKLIELARTEKDPALRQQAIQHLGSMPSAAAADALIAMYRETTETDTRKRILRSLASQRSAKQLIEVARAEKDVDLRRQALQHLVGMRSQEATDYFLELLK